MPLDPRRVLASTAEALSGEFDLDDVLEHIVDAAQQLTGARYVALGVIGEDHGLARFVHTGLDDDTVRAIGHLPTGRGVLGLLIREPRLIRLDSISDHPASVGFPPHHPPMGAFLGAPVRMSGQVYGNLYLSEKDGGFTEEDEVWVALLAAQAGAAIENAVLSDRLRSLAVQAERDRISRDLHDGIIQALFSIGMTLESAVSLIGTAPDRARQRISDSVDRIDDAIRDLRNTIFHLRPNTAAVLGLRAGIVELAREHEVNALTRPRIDVPPDIDAHVPEHAVPDLLQVVREGLANVARHAGPCAVSVRAEVTSVGLVIEIHDEGVGFVPTTPAVGRGLENVSERAAVLGGAVTLDSEPGSGTVLRLTVPLRGETN